MPQHSSNDSSNAAFNNSFKEGSDHNPSVAGRHSQLILNGNQIINIPVDSSTNKIIITQECVKISKKGKNYNLKYRVFMPKIKSRVGEM
jgi:hypothetical protein